MSTRNREYGEPRLIGEDKIVIIRTSPIHFRVSFVVVREGGAMFVV
jgi:hypothetical protein